MPMIATRTFMYDNKMYFKGDALDVDQEMATQLGSLVEKGESEVAKSTEDFPPATSPIDPTQRETKPAKTKTKMETK